MQRIDKRLAATGRWSRSEAKALVIQGRVTRNGIQVNRPEEKVEETDLLAVDGQEMERGSALYLMLHKPAGVLSATQDREQKTALDLLPLEYQRRGLFPVGRLDKDTEGLLLLTDDGELAHRLLAPKNAVEKVYFAQVEGELGPADVEALAEGLLLRDGTVCLPARMELLEEGSAALVILHEGKYHQVRRMLAARGAPVAYLKRLRMGDLRLDEGLLPGQWRPLTEEEISGLKSLVY